MAKNLLRSTVVVFWLLCAVYFLTRLLNLTILPIFNDEAIYLNWSQTMTENIHQVFLPLSDGKQPLFMWITAFLYALAGNMVDPLFLARFVSVIAGFLSMLGIFLLLRQLASLRTAIWGMVFYIVSPIFLFYDRFAVPDNVLATTSIWSLYFSIRVVTNTRIRDALLLGICLGLGLLTKSPAIFFIAMLPLIAAVGLLGHSHVRQQCKRFLVCFGLAIIIAFAVSSILRISSLYPIIAQRTPDFVFPLSRIVTSPLDPFLVRITDVIKWLWAYLSWPILLLSLVGLVYGLVKRNKVSIYCFIWCITPLVIEMEYAKAFTPRYLLFTLPPLLILSVMGWDFLWQWLQKRQPYLKYCLLLCFIPALVFDYFVLFAPDRAPIPLVERSVYITDWSSGYGIPQVVDYIRKTTQTHDVLVGTEGRFGALPDGLIVYNRKKRNIKIEGMGQDAAITSLPSALVDWVEQGEGKKAFLVVHESRMQLSDRSNLTLLAKYPKPVSPNGQEFLLLYEVKKP